MAELIFGDYAQAFSPEVACYIGLKKAIVIQGFHYWLEKNKEENRNFKDGCYWCYNSYEDWKRISFSYMSERDIRRVIKELEDDGYLISRKYNAYRGDCRKWYTINYEKFHRDMIQYREEAQRKEKEEILQKEQEALEKELYPCVQNGQRVCPEWTEQYTITTQQETQLNGLNVANYHSPYRFDENIFRKSIVKACHTCGIESDKLIDDVKTVMHYYRLKYLRKHDKPHPFLNQNCMCIIVNVFINGNAYIPIVLGDRDFVEYYMDLIDSYFDTDILETDHNMMHFMNEEILHYRDLDIMYY